MVAIGHSLVRIGGLRIVFGHSLARLLSGAAKMSSLSSES